MLTANNADGRKTAFPVPAGMEIHFHLPALHYNRMPSLFLILRTGPYCSLTATYWKDPHTFRPQRFLEDYPKNAFLPFSAGRSGPVMTPERTS